YQHADICFATTATNISSTKHVQGASTRLRPHAFELETGTGANDNNNGARRRRHRCCVLGVAS
ncbi:unnamed protein product, partial [Phaeothamnion confervicola]